MDNQPSLPATPNLVERLRQQGISRRDFLRFCRAMAIALALPKSFKGRIAQALSDAPRLPVIWLEFQDCAGDTASLLRASQPSLLDLLLEVIALEYHETLMAPAGTLAEKSRDDVVRNYAGRYLAIVEGSIPTADNGVYCLIGGRTALDIAQEVCRHAWATIALGGCGWDGGAPAAAPDPTGAVGIMQAVPGLHNVLNLPGCPLNGINLAAAIVHLVSFNQLPPTDAEHRPLFAYGHLICHRCERRHFHHAGRFVRAWGDEGHRKGWCLYQMGCRGPITHHNCPLVHWNDGTSWPVASGHGCIGCAELRFWDRLPPVYTPLAKGGMGAGGMGRSGGMGGAK